MYRIDRLFFVAAMTSSALVAATTPTISSVRAYTLHPGGATIPFLTIHGHAESGMITYPASDDSNVGSTDGFGADLVQSNSGLTPPLGQAVFVAGVTVYGLPMSQTTVTKNVNFSGQFGIVINAATALDTSKTYIVFTIDRNNTTGESTWSGPSQIGSVTSSKLTFSAPLPVIEPEHYCAFVVSEVAASRFLPLSYAPASVVGQDLSAQLLSH